MTCNHPQACQDAHGQCGWCRDTSRLQNALQAIQNLQDQLGKTAIVVQGGTHTLHIEGPIGYLSIKNASVCLARSEPKPAEPPRMFIYPTRSGA